MPKHTFVDVITSETALRDAMGSPSDLVVRKQLDHLDVHARRFIERSPFLLIASSGLDHVGDVSTRGDAPGFVAILDEHTLVIPERPGNRRIDTLRNILHTGGVGLIFLIPGFEETLRVNGRAQVVDLRGAVIPGLYAGGEVAGGFGMHGLPRCTCQGFIAGRQAAAEAV